MERIEKIGAFYLGREYDAETGTVTDRDVMYDARDLTTHAVCLGMTGSGKTGLCIDLLEEAALDGVPAIIIDPKGDITNLLLTFPELRPEDFQPWVNIDDARRKDLTVEEYALKVSEDWRNGLAEWGQRPERISALKNGTEFTIFTPGSDSGAGVSILSALSSPELDWERESETLRERVQGTVSALLGLVGIDADPLQSREYTLLATLIEHYWRQGTDLDLPMLISAVQDPPVEKFGVFDLETFFPKNDRFKFALALNTIIASPDFSAWLSGEPLDIPSLLRSSSGKPRHSIFYLAHLPESRRMFFVTLLLEQVVSWMRVQSGTTSLRAVLYFDEVFGFLPPVEEPPSKKPLLRLLKQARAVGLGVVLTSQNPVDIDYKALSNAGTWFIGRLQTERDKKRLLDGLESISSESGTVFDRSGADSIISSLGKRVFLLHNVHEERSLIFNTRWAMSYLRGPLTRDQVRTLMKDRKTVTGREIPASSPAPSPAVIRKPVVETPDLSSARPVISSEFPPLFLPLRITAGSALETVGVKSSGVPDLVYEPALIALGRVSFVDRKRNITKTEERTFVLGPEDAGIAIQWENTEITGLTMDDLSKREEPGSKFAGGPPSEWTSSRKLKSISKDLSNYLYYNSTFELPMNPELKLHSLPGEPLQQFRARCSEKTRELRDAEVDKLRDSSRKKLDRLQVRLDREERELEEDRSDYRGRKSEELLSAGESIIGLLGLFGSRRSSALSSAARKRRMTQSAKADIQESEEEIERLEKAIEELENEVRGKAEEIVSKWESAAEAESMLVLKPRRTDVQILLVSPAWAPFYHSMSDGAGSPARIAGWTDADQPS